MIPFRRSRQEDERELLGRATEWPEYRSWPDLTGDVLRQVSRDDGIDFATAVLFDRLLRSQEHGSFIRQMNQLLQQQSEARFATDVLAAIVPGAFYLEHPETGADGQAVRDAAHEVACRTDLIPIASLGTPLGNGRTVSDWLRQRREEKVILVSLSKGGADVKMALAEPRAEEAFENVIAWLNVSGIVNGSPVVTWGLARPLQRFLVRSLFWIRGRDFRFVEDLRQTKGPLDFELRTSQHMKTIHIVGFPLRRHLSSGRARRWHRRLSPLGPNDSVTMLYDVCRLPGLVLPVWGADHYLQSGWNVQQLVTALLQYLGDELGLFQVPKAAGSTASSLQP